jgi:hypothetical protein
MIVICRPGLDKFLKLVQSFFYSTYHVEVIAPVIFQRSMRGNEERIHGQTSHHDH